ncbi:MAG: ATP-dependent RNA helicase [Myxococcales bacterium]|nr:ATP-dependent RNA helicase [Myxococcales bacterium]
MLYDRVSAARPSIELPIDSLRPAFAAALGAGPVVISAPTGSGKSTCVPVWLLDDAAPGQTVWVIEPRRVACRALASRVASLLGTRLGGRVGYRVRDDDRTSAETQLIFATPGIALRQLAQVRACKAVVVDELHERRLDVDLLLALLRHERTAGLVVMSATFAGDEIAGALGGTHLQAEGRLFPVRVAHLGDRPPDRQDLPERVEQALSRAEKDPGDVLVFLPGKGEIGAVYERLERRRDIATLTLHGGLTLDEQARVFEPAPRRKVILCTNVAETSLTVPGVGVVIDSGLVRRTRYHQGRGFLTLMPIADDSAEQRAGRAGRTAAGVCYRLWSEATRLAPATPPEMHRESLVPLVLGAAGAGVAVRALPFLDPPKEHALAQAESELRALGALDDSGVTDTGRALSGLPIDAALGRLVVEAQAERARGQAALADDVLTLVAALAVGRPLFTAPPRELDMLDGSDLRSSGCDVVALVRALREGDPQRHPLHGLALREARQLRERLRQALGLSGREDAGGGDLRAPRGDAGLDRAQLARVILAADPRSAYVARHRKHGTAWANGGTEIDLGRESALRLKQEREEGRRDAPKVDAVLILDTRAIGASARDTKLIATCVMPVPTAWLVQAGVGEEQLGNVTREKGRIVATLERVYAGTVLNTREAKPEGALAREAIAQLFMQGRLFKGSLGEAKRRLQERALAAALAGTRVGDTLGLGPQPAPPPLDDFLRARLLELGVASVDDLSLLSADDVLPEPLPAYESQLLAQEFPARVSVGDAEYVSEIDVEQRLVTLRMVRGTRKTPPPASYIPRFGGYKVCAEAARVLHVVRGPSR